MQIPPHAHCHVFHHFEKAKVKDLKNILTYYVTPILSALLHLSCTTATEPLY